MSLYEILKKYNISFNDMSLEKDGRKSQRLSLRFLAYNEYEAASIINSILMELGQKQIDINPQTIEVSPEIKKYIVPDELKWEIIEYSKKVKIKISKIKELKKQFNEINSYDLNFNNVM